jgi:hypothetical protein
VTARADARLFKKVKEEDVADSAADLRGALADIDGIEVVADASDADAVVLVLERGREKTLGLPGMRKVRVRVTAGDRSIELVGQDSALGFNTWKGAAKGVARQVVSWFRGAPS